MTFRCAPSNHIKVESWFQSTLTFKHTIGAMNFGWSAWFYCVWFRFISIQLLLSTCTHPVVSWHRTIATICNQLAIEIKLNCSRWNTCMEFAFDSIVFRCTCNIQYILIKVFINTLDCKYMFWLLLLVNTVLFPLWEGIFGVE